MRDYDIIFDIYKSDDIKKIKEQTMLNFLIIMQIKQNILFVLNQILQMIMMIQQN
jgi:hypothetical protein